MRIGDVVQNRQADAGVFESYIGADNYSHALIGSLFCASYHYFQNDDRLGLITGGRHDRGSTVGIYIADHTAGTSTSTNLQGSLFLTLMDRTITSLYFLVVILVTNTYLEEHILMESTSNTVLKHPPIVT